MRKFLYIEPRKTHAEPCAVLFFLRRRALFRPNFFVIYQKTVENKLFHCYN